MGKNKRIPQLKNSHLESITNLSSQCSANQSSDRLASSARHRVCIRDQSRQQKTPSSKSTAQSPTQQSPASRKAKSAAKKAEGADLSGKASELAGQAKGKASELAGEAKGKAAEVKGEVKKNM